MPAGKIALISAKLEPDTDVENRRNYDNKTLIMCSARKYYNFFSNWNNFI